MVLSSASDLAAVSSVSTKAAERQSLRRNLLYVLPFICLFLIQLAHHELWRDELNAWGISAAAPNPKVLFQYVRYEGHPAIWYFLLWPVARITNAPEALKAIEAVIGIAIYLFLALRSPFTTWEKLLLYISYFISFEYMVLARMYSVVLLLTLIYAYGRSAKPRSVVLNALVLGLLANTEVCGLILAAAFSFEYAVYLWRTLENDPEKRAFIRSQIIPGIAVLALCLGTTYMALRISPHITWRERPLLFEFARKSSHAYRAIACAISLPWLPINPRFPEGWWNPVPWEGYEHMQLFYAAPFVLAGYVAVFRRYWAVLGALAISLLLTITFNHLIYFGSTRHFGTTFLVFLVFVWYKRYSGLRASRVETIFLVITGLGGVLAAYAQWDHPFSQGPNTVKYIRDHKLDSEMLLVTPDTAGAEIAELLRKPVYFLDCNCISTFLLYSNARDEFKILKIPERLKIAAEKLHRRNFTLVTNYPIVDRLSDMLHDEGVTFRLEKAFPGGEEPQEKYYIFKLAMK